MDREILIQALTDPENQPHQWVGDAEGLRAALKSGDKGRWQDISTAPKDGTTIDVYCGNAEFPSRITDVSFREPTDSEFWVHGSSEPDPKEGTIGAEKQWLCYLSGPLISDMEPTHWQPLPAPPTSEGV